MTRSGSAAISVACGTIFALVRISGLQRACGDAIGIGLLFVIILACALVEWSCSGVLAALWTLKPLVVASVRLAGEFGLIVGIYLLDETLRTFTLEPFTNAGNAVRL